MSVEARSNELQQPQVELQLASTNTSTITIKSELTTAAFRSPARHPLFALVSAACAAVARLKLQQQLSLCPNLDSLLPSPTDSAKNNYLHKYVH